MAKRQPKSSNSTTGGSATLKARGLKPIMFGATRSEHAEIGHAALDCESRMSHFARAAALFCARNPNTHKGLREILQEIHKSA